MSAQRANKRILCLCSHCQHVVWLGRLRREGSEALPSHPPPRSVISALSGSNRDPAHWRSPAECQPANSQRYSLARPLVPRAHHQASSRPCPGAQATLPVAPLGSSPKPLTSSTIALSGSACDPGRWPAPAEGQAVDGGRYGIARPSRPAPIIKRYRGVPGSERDPARGAAPAEGQAAERGRYGPRAREPCPIMLGDVQRDSDGGRSSARSTCRRPRLDRRPLARVGRMATPGPDQARYPIVIDPMATGQAGDPARRTWPERQATESGGTAPQQVPPGDAAQSPRR